MEFGIAFQNTCFETMAFPTETTKTTETTKLFRINFMHDFLCMAAMRLSHNQFLNYHMEEKRNEIIITVRNHRSCPYLTPF